MLILKVELQKAGPFDSTIRLKWEKQDHIYLFYGLGYKTFTRKTSKMLANSE